MPPVGFEPHSLGREAAAELRLRPLGRWDRQITNLTYVKCDDGYVGREPY